ncbi:MAG: 23S rRNA pseudouridine(955/2504/2580) synthase, partial [Candidatus Omnitrophica bacterium]|nr:23S rRNA pseudouridine(955/2504/2580) synthase [Candidatus Omnitrophota bacterium]
EARPVTGRTNQLRVHFKQIGHPVVGESKFAFRKDFKLRFRRLCLHAKSLEFTHPLSGKTINLSVDLPKDLQEFLDKH